MLHDGTEEIFGVGDKVLVFHTRKTEDGEIIVTEKHEAIKLPEKEPTFCLDCGEPLTPLLIYYCKACKQRYLVQFDETIGKPIIVPMGREES